MINSKKKGFTIVELVIVIAVVAILAAVLIPTFSNLVKKANVSADQQAVRQINTLLATEFATERPEEIRDVMDMLEENGYNTKALKPLASGYSFVWNKAENKIEYLLETEIPEGLVDLNDGLKYINVEITSKESLKEALSNGSDVTLSQDIVLDGEGGFEIAEEEDVTINLGGHTLTVKNTAGTQSPYAFATSGKLKIENGVINARGVQAYPGGTLIIGENVEINAIDSNGGAALYCWAGGEIIVEGGKFTANNGVQGTDGPALIINAGGNVTVKGGTYETTNSGAYAIICSGGTLTIENAKVTAFRGALCVEGEGKIIVNNGSFKVTDNGIDSAYIGYADGGEIVLNGGTYESANEKEFYGNVVNNSK